MTRGSKNNGFTLLEMIVSLAIFSVVAIVAVSSLVRITGLNRQAQSLQAAMTNISFALESMSREIRMGSGHSCYTSGDALPSWSSYVKGQDCNPGTGELIVFRSDRVYGTSPNKCNLLIAYRLYFDDGYILQKDQQESCDDYTVSFETIIDPKNISLDSLVLDLTHIGGYAWTNIRIKGQTGVKAQEKRDFDVQTSVASRTP